MPQMQTMAPVKAAQALNSCEYTASTSRGDYLVQVSWPLTWNQDRTVREDEDVSAISTVYIVDGNAYFFSATDVVRRLELGAKKAIIVGVGYPITNSIFHRRRAADLTAPAADGEYDIPPGRDGRPQRGIAFGGASDFLEVIRKDIMSYVEGTLFPHIPLREGRKALFGHSYGGLFTLNAIFTKPGLFDTFIAASPSIWWNNLSIVHEQEKAFREDDTPVQPKPRLLITFGSGEQYLVQKPGESDEYFKKKQEFAEGKRMKDNALEMVARLEKCPRLRQVWKWEFQDEDHGSAASCALQRGLVKFLDELIEV
ncbi:Fc.00g103650.m01.CDS01 [Cosmosporella sp. VM-42]